MARIAFLPTAVLVALTLLTPARAWTPDSRVHLVEEATRLMPASLRLALESHRRDVLRGVLEPLEHEDDVAHRAPWNGGTLEATIDAEAKSLLEALRAGARFPEVARRFGRLAHFVADAGFPPGVSDRDGSSRYEHFAAFCESRRPRFPIVFQGHDDDALGRGDWLAFAHGVARRASGEDAELARAYAAAGRPPDPTHFDDRSVPFAVGQLSWSGSINDVTQAWFTLWEQAGGDTGRTPYRASRAAR